MSLEVVVIVFAKVNLKEVFLKEFRYIEKEKMVIRYITDDLKFPSDDSEE